MPPPPFPQDLQGIGNTILERTIELVPHANNLPTFELYKDLLLLLARKQESWLTHAFFTLEVHHPDFRHRVNYRKDEKILLKHAGKEESLTPWEIIQQLRQQKDHFEESDNEESSDSESEDSDQPSLLSLQELSIIAENAVLFGAGNCGERNAVILLLALQYPLNPQQKLYVYELDLKNATELFPIAGADDEHVLTLITPAPNINPRNISTWGDGIIIDAWKEVHLSVTPLTSTHPSSTPVGHFLQKASKEDNIRVGYRWRMGTNFKRNANAKIQNFWEYNRAEQPKEPVKFNSEVPQTPEVIAQLALQMALKFVTYSNTLNTQSNGLYVSLLTKLAQNPHHWISQQLAQFNLHDPAFKTAINSDLVISLKQNDKESRFSIDQLINILTLDAANARRKATYQHMSIDQERDNERYETECHALQACKFQAGSAEDISNVIIILLAEYHFADKNPFYYFQICSTRNNESEVFILLTSTKEEKIDLNDIQTWGQDALLIDIMNQQVLRLAPILAKKSEALNAPIYRMIQRVLESGFTFQILHQDELGIGHSKKWQENPETRDLKLTTYVGHLWNKKPAVPFTAKSEEASGSSSKRFKQN